MLCHFQVSQCSDTSRELAEFSCWCITWWTISKCYKRPRSGDKPFFFTAIVRRLVQGLKLGELQNLSRGGEIGFAAQLLLLSLFKLYHVRWIVYFYHVPEICCFLGSTDIWPCNNCSKCNICIQGISNAKGRVLYSCTHAVKYLSEGDGQFIPWFFIPLFFRLV